MSWPVRIARKTPALVRLRFGLPRTLRRLARGRGEVAPPPHVVLLRLTDRCSLRCRGCGLWGEQGVGLRREAATELDRSGWEEILRQIAPMRPLLHFWGGEPLLRADDLTGLTRQASQLRLPVTLFTSGVGLADRAEDLCEAGLDGIYVSLDGPEELCDHLRGPGAFHAAVEGVQAILAARRRGLSPLPRVQINMTILDGNEGAVEATARIARDLGADRFSVQLGILTSHQRAHQTSDRLQQKLGRPWPGWSGFVRDGDAIDTAVLREGLRAARTIWSRRYAQYPPERVHPSLDTHFRSLETVHGGAECLAPWIRAQIAPDGHLSFCEDVPDLAADSVLDRPFLEAWNGDLPRAFRRLILQDGLLPACTRCCGLYELQSDR